MTEEERLQDALAAVGDTLGPADVPALTLSPQRRLRPSRRAGLAAAAAASLAAVTAGAFFTIGSAGDRQQGLDRVRPAPATLRDAQMSIFLCTKTSANPACDRRDVTAAQREAIEATLRTFPEVRFLGYESKQEAYERFRAQFAKNPGIVRSTRSGDIPEAFRLVLREPDQYPKVASAVANMPGVDRIIDENAIATPPGPRSTGRS